MGGGTNLNMSWSHFQDLPVGLVVRFRRACVQSSAFLFGHGSIKICFCNCLGYAALGRGGQPEHEPVPTPQDLPVGWVVRFRRACVQFSCWPRKHQTT